MIGITCGLAIYNSTVVDLHFPLALYKKLLNVNPGLEDLKELSPTEGRYRAKRQIGVGNCSGCLWQCGLKFENTTGGTGVSVWNYMVVCALS